MDGASISYSNLKSLNVSSFSGGGGWGWGKLKRKMESVLRSLGAEKSRVFSLSTDHVSVGPNVDRKTVRILAYVFWAEIES